MERARAGSRSGRPRPGREVPGGPDGDVGGRVGGGVGGGGGGGVGGSPASPNDPQAAYRVAWAIALRRIEIRDRTRAEIADTLRSRATPADVMDAVLTRLTALGLLDDARVARTWVESSRRTRGLAGRALTTGLLRRGVAPELVAAAVGDVDRDEQQDAALQLARAGVARLRSRPTEVITRRVAGQLARRGHEPGVAYRAVRTAVDEAGLGDHAAPGAGEFVE